MEWVWGSCCKYYTSIISNGTTIPFFYCDVDKNIYAYIDACQSSCYRELLGQKIYLSVETLQAFMFLLGILVGFAVVSALLKAIL